MATISTATRIYRFGPAVRILTVVAAVGLIAAGIWEIANAFSAHNGVIQQFFGIVLGMVPVALALFGAPAVLRCQLEVHEDRLEYQGLLIEASIPRSAIVDALSPRESYGMFSLFLTVAGKPFKRLHIAILGKKDEAFERWYSDLPHGQTAKV
ncbi:hypothetical protein AEAC466_07575 [Asticcacaulis sp. AC466]|nr:hypothetical protein AEAC466_07575 [Asticcacaulis sp. AC466]